MQARHTRGAGAARGRVAFSLMVPGARGAARIRGGPTTGVPFGSQAPLPPFRCGGSQLAAFLNRTLAAVRHSSGP